MGRKLKKYTIEEKLRLLKLAEEVGHHEVERRTGVSRKSLRDWRERKEMLNIMMGKKKKYRLKGGGKKPDSAAYEEQLINWIQKNRKLEISISTSEIIVQACKIIPNFSSKSLHALRNWCYRFLDRIGYSIRRITHQGQSLPNNSTELLVEFLKQNILNRRESGVFDDLSRMVNVDETPIFFEMHNRKTIEKIGSKEVNVKTFGYDKRRISAILAVSADGTKLPPMLIFQGQKGKKNLGKKLYNLDIVKDKKIFVYFQENAWADAGLFIKWLLHIWKAYVALKDCNPCLLVYDKAPSHVNDEIKKILKDTNTALTLIPPGFTRYLQPLDRSINKPFKDYLRKKYLEFQIENNNTKKSKKEDIIQWVYDIWYDEKLITKEIIKLSFLRTGISNRLDGSDDQEFDWPTNISSEIE